MLKTASISLFLSRWVFITGVSVVPLWIVGQIFRDRVWVTALFFYIPSPVMTIWLIAAAALALRGGRRGRALVCTLMALLPLAMILFVENRWTRLADVVPSSGS